jgi:hypothetical protein
MAKADPRIADRWRTDIALWRSSGLSLAAFCRSRDLNLSRFYRWRNILDDLDWPAATRTRPAACSVLRAHSRDPRCRRRGDASLPSGILLRVPPADAQQLAHVVRALRATDSALKQGT